MFKYFSLLALVVLFSCNSSKQSTGNNRLTIEEKNEGWKLLFDGESTRGWHKYGNKPVGAAWKVKDGYLYLDTTNKDGGDIVTEEEYGNFHFQLEWRISKNGNSGIIFYIHEDKSKYNWPWETGMEMQVLDNEGHPDGKIRTHHAGDLFDLVASSKETVKPVGEWNLAEIKCINGKLDLYLNGENIVSTTLWDDGWRKMVANSKFRNMPGFGTFKNGRIGLQDHGNEVSFRNIKIKRL
ncbi:MAG: DUF1080 domain-containing protein [Chitinophagaceae bacterium]